MAELHMCLSSNAMVTGTHNNPWIILMWLTHEVIFVLSRCDFFTIPMYHIG